MFSKNTSSLLLVLFLHCLLTLTVQGICDFNKLKIDTKATGFNVEDQTAYLVSVTNTCVCTQFDVIIDCTGFQTDAPLDPAVVSKLDEHRCLLKNGQYLHGNDSVAFIYSSEQVFKFKPLSSSIACG